jgi:ABC-type phosphate/phosphonate transport system permease subunit
VVVGLVGAGGLGTLLALQLAAFVYRGVLATLLASSSSPSSSTS